MHPQVAQNLGAYAIVAQVGGEAQSLIGFHRIQADILEGIGLELVDQADTPTLLAQVNHHALSGLLDHAQGRLQLRPAITAQGAKGIPRKTFAVHPHQHGPAGCFWLAFDDGHMFTAIQLIYIANSLEIAKGAG